AQLRTELLYGQDQYARRLAAYSAELEHLIAAGDWVRGLQRLSDGAVEFGDEPRVRELAGHLRQQMHDSQFRTLDADVRQALDSGDLQQAREQLAASAPGFAQDEGWKRLQGELEQRELFEQLLIKGEDCRHNRDFPGAESAFKKALQLNVPTQRAADLLQSAYEDRDSEIKILSQVAIVDSKVQAGDIDDAMKLLSELRLMFPNEPEVIYRLQTVASLQQRLSPTRASDQPVPANPGTAATTPADGSETQSKPISTLRNLFKRVRR
ncbi:MAG TPA: hypothetical protein VEQ63_01090, partial [Bryobacteraceae bacterium]|nr:hypothetical protein [Bryobacteraceae bacterium]